MARKKKSKYTDKDYCWLVAYINSAYIERVYTDMKKSLEYADMEVYIPTVRILKKTFKGENLFEEVPLLFNYGFFKVLRKYAIHPTYLENMKKNISCIYAWVKDPAKVLAERPKLRMDNKYVFTDKDVPIATATSEEISKLLSAAYYNHIYDSDDIDKLAPGQVINLRGYPFDNILAEVVEVYPEKHKVKVKMGILDQVREVMVTFDNVFFTIYHNQSFDDSVTLAGAIEMTTERKPNKNKHHG